MLQVPVREHTNLASTKAVILVCWNAARTHGTDIARLVVPREELVSDLCLWMFPRFVYPRSIVCANTYPSPSSMLPAILSSTTASRHLRRSPISEK